MNVTAEKIHNCTQVDVGSNTSSLAALRIAICPPEFQPFQKVMSGGPADATHIIQKYVAAGLLAQGHSLTFVVPRNLAEIVCTTDIKNPRAAHRTWSESRWFGIASKGAWRIQRWLGVPYLNMFSNLRLLDACLHCLPGHDLVYERNSLYRFGVAMACKRLGLPYVLYFEADDIQESDFMGEPITGLLRWRAREAIRYNLRAADCLICVSDAGKVHLMNAWDVPSEKIVVFPNAVDVHRFRPDLQTSGEVRASLGVESNPLVIFIGNFFHWHDVVTLLDAFAQVLLVYPDARLILVGDGARRQAMVRHTAELGIGHAVQFTGLVAHAEVPRLLAAADVAVVPYPSMKHELWLSPLKLFEYMASGTAVIASAVGQILEVIQDGRNGLLVPPADVSAMAAGLQRLIGDTTLRARLGQNAREDAVRKHSWEQYVLRLDRLFSAVITSQPFGPI
jgi:glycosyltransferase involved in cell wall biosynthesis